MPPIDWLPWATPAFQRAQQTRRPVLLLLETAWSTPCRTFADETLSAAEVVRRITSDFVAVRVDVDWRPDIADRYGIGAWPALLALTPEGQVLGGGTPRKTGLADWLALAARLFHERDRQWPASLPGPPSPTTATDPATASSEIWEQLASARDPATGAFGADGQPELGPALAAFAGAATDIAPFLADAASATIDRLLASPRWDPRRGLLLCRGATAWTAGEVFARVESQAEWVRLLSRAVACDPRRDWRDALVASTHGLLTCFETAPGAWSPRSGGPSVTFVDATARASRALLAAADVLDDANAARAAIEALESMLPRAYSRGAGVAHVLTTRVHGPALLGDAMLVAHALLDADHWAPTSVYRDLAEELVRSAFSRLVHSTGALLDRRHTMAGGNAVGRLSMPLCPLEGNADAARACIRLGPYEEHWQALALQVLRGVHTDGRDAAGFAAPLALAWAAVLTPDHAISVW